MALLERTGRFLGFTDKVVVESGEETVMAIPPLSSGHQVSVTAIPGSNTAKVEHTTSPDADVAGGSATWQEWPPGSVTSTTSDVITGPITGLRFSAVGGQCSFEVVI